jgi:adenylate kinase family enzyme
MKIQVIGLPGSGKTTYIKEYLDKKLINNTIHYDTTNFFGENFEQNFRNKVKYSKENVIAESACGVYIPNSEVIRLDIPADIRRRQYENREGENLDIQYESLLETRMIPAKYTVTNKKALFEVLDKLLVRNN